MKLVKLGLGETSLDTLSRAVGFVLLASAAGSAWYYSINAARLSAARENLHTCRQLATAIQAAKQTPHRARLETGSLDDLSTAIENAAASAQLARERVLRIDPQAPKRLGKTDYMEQATEVELTEVTLPQIINFIYEVGGRDEQLRTDTLRLRMPHVSTESTTEELWLADVILTQRIYAPTTPHR
jgi:type II secretory pathway pseudopilin PulG